MSVSPPEPGAGCASASGPDPHPQHAPAPGADLPAGTAAAAHPVPRFHLAFPVTDLEATRRFYVDVLGCRTGRESERWIDFDFHGHQLVAHLVPPEQHPAAARNAVDGEQVPAFHFGPIIEWVAFDALAARLRSAGVPFLVEPTVRFAGRAGEQKTLFILDPSGNGLEFKAFRDIAALFARDPDAYR